MRISTDTPIATMPAIAARRLMLDIGAEAYAAEGITDMIAKRAPQVDSQEAFKQLVAQHYIRQVQEIAGVKYFGLDQLGSQLSAALAAKPISRKTADAAVQGLLERVERANAKASPFSYRVKRVVIFGSYLSDADKIGDVDVGVELEGKFPNMNRQQEADFQRADSSDRRFGSIIDRLGWAREEVLHFLKDGKRSLQFSDIDNPAVTSGNIKQIYPREA